MKGFYSNILKGIQNGEDRYDELYEIKSELNKIYKEIAKERVDRMKAIHIDDHTFDIHKLQNQKKFEGLGRINEINIDDVNYTGISNVVKAFELKIAKEVSEKTDNSMDAPVTEEEEYFLALYYIYCRPIKDGA